MVFRATDSVAAEMGVATLLSDEGWHQYCRGSRRVSRFFPTVDHPVRSPFDWHIAHWHWVLSVWLSSLEPDVSAPLHTYKGQSSAILSCNRAVTQVRGLSTTARRAFWKAAARTDGARLRSIYICALIRRTKRGYGYG